MNTLMLKSLSTKEKNEELGIFIREHIADFQGEFEEGYPLPRMLFVREDLARSFANEASKWLDIPFSSWIFVTANSARKRSVTKRI